MIDEKENIKTDNIKEIYKEEEEEKKEKRQTTTLEKNETKQQPIPIHPTQELFIRIPQIPLLSGVNLVRKSTALNAEIPKISVEKVELTVPEIELQKPPSFKRLQIQLNVTIPEPQKETVTLLIPEIELSKPSLTRANRRLVLDIPDIKPQPVELTVPSIDLELPRLIRKSIKLEEKPPFLPVIPQVEEKSERKEEELAGIASEGGEEDKEFLEEIFEFDKSSGGGVGELKSPEGVKVVIFSDYDGYPYLDLLQEICLRLYKILSGDLPQAREVAIESSSLDEFTRYDIQTLKGGNKIFTIKIDKEKFDEIRRSEIREKIVQRLRELYAQPLGFIIFALNDANAKIYEELSTLLTFETASKPYIIKISSRRLPLELVSIVNGMVKLPEGLTETYPFNYAFNETKKKYIRKLERILNEEDGLYRVLTKRNEGNESPQHYQLKAFVVRYLVNELKKQGKIKYPYDIVEIEKDVKTEEPIVENLKADVVYGDHAYEIETLFEEGEKGGDPIGKIVEKIRKYIEKSPQISSLNIVMDNFTLLLYHKEIRGVIKWLKKRNPSFNIRVYGIDVENKTLVPLEELLKKYKEILRKFNEMSKKLNG